MGFHEARAELVRALKSGDYEHWQRKDAPRKNWLQYHRVSVDEVRLMLDRCSGMQHRESDHDFEPGLRVHEFFPLHQGERWYVKAFRDPDVGKWMFMSVHPSGD